MDVFSQLVESGGAVVTHVPPVGQHQHRDARRALLQLPGTVLPGPEGMRGVIGGGVGWGLVWSV